MIFAGSTSWFTTYHDYIVYMVSVKLQLLNPLIEIRLVSTVSVSARRFSSCLNSMKSKCTHSQNQLNAIAEITAMQGLKNAEGFSLNFFPVVLTKTEYFYLNQRQSNESIHIQDYQKASPILQKLKGNFRVRK